MRMLKDLSRFEIPRSEQKAIKGRQICDLDCYCNILQTAWVQSFLAGDDEASTVWFHAYANTCNPV